MSREQSLKVAVSAPLGVGGISTMMINIQRHLDRKKINFDYLVFHDRKEPCEDQVLALGSKKIVASADDVAIRTLRRLIRMNRIRKACKENNVKILHYNADSPADLTNIIAAKWGGVSYVTVHAHSSSFGKVSRGIRLISMILKPFMPFFCDHYLGCSDLAARFVFPSSVIKKKNYSILPNGIELKKYDFNPDVRNDVRKQLKLENNFVIGHAGRFSPEKNHEFLLEIFAEIYKQEQSARLLLFGVGDLMEQIKKKAEKLKISDVTYFCGASNEMHRMWQAMDVFVMPSLYEGLPVTGIEAQVSGLPSVFSESITPEVDISEKSIFISLRESPKCWAENILKLRGKTRASGYKKLLDACYDIQQTADLVSEFYLSVAEKL